jgi:hypothetical protein
VYHCCRQYTRSIVPSGKWPPPTFRANFGECGSINASSIDHGTTAVIPARKTSRFVRFFFDKKVNRRKALLIQSNDLSVP